MLEPFKLFLDLGCFGAIVRFWITYLRVDNSKCNQRGLECPSSQPGQRNMVAELQNSCEELICIELRWLPNIEIGKAVSGKM